MNFKKYFSILITLIVFSTFFCGFSFFKKEKVTEKPQTKQETINKKPQYNRDVWCITLQLVWNDLIDNFVKKPIKFIGGNPEIADYLNKRLYSKDDISENSYYIKNGKISAELKEQIESDIYKKFQEKSDILDSINWEQKDSYLFYTMLVKNFNFLNEFDILKSQEFNNIENTKVKFFGINTSNKNLKENIRVLFYNNADEYAVKLLTKEDEEIILFRTDKNDSFENIYSYIKENSKSDSFKSEDKIKVPYINVNETISFDELCNKSIKGTNNYVISKAIQTIKLNMDNKGGKLKSEAALSIMRLSLAPMPKVRYFYYDKPFYLFIKETAKDNPYYAMKVIDTKYLVNEEE